MSFDSRNIMMDENKKNESVVATYQRRDVHFESAPSYTSSLFVHLRQLQTDIQTQYQHEKHALVELNDRFRHFIDRVQQLETQNAKYMAQLVNYRRPTSDVSSADLEYNERYLHMQSDLIAVTQGSIDLGLEVEMYKLQTAIYQQLIDFEQQYKDERRVKLEQELNQASLTLNSLRASNSEIGREVENLYAARGDAYQQYLRLTQDWSRIKKQSKEWALNMQLLKNQVAFYKNIRSHSSQGGRAVVSVDTFDVKQFWALELEKVIKSIRHDFQQLYSTFHSDMTLYYSTQLKEAETEIVQALNYQTTEVESYSSNLETIQIDYEKVQKTYSYEKELLMKLEASYSKMEIEFQSLQRQNDERFEFQGRELDSLQENITIVAYDIEEMRQKKINLEGEIIVYRHLLDSYGVHDYTVHVPTPSPVAGTLTRKYIVKSQKKGSVGIRECPPDGAFITLINHSPDKVVDISRWSLKRRIDATAELRYTLPDGVRLQPSTELRIYSKQGANVAKSLEKNRSVISSARQDLVNSEVVSWGTGNSTETFLYNQHGEEKAVFSQSIAVASSNIL